MQRSPFTWAHLAPAGDTLGFGPAVRALMHLALEGLPEAFTPIDFGQFGQRRWRLQQRLGRRLHTGSRLCCLQRRSRRFRCRRFHGLGLLILRKPLSPSRSRIRHHEIEQVWVPLSGYHALFQQRLPFLIGKPAPPFSLVGIAANLPQPIPGRSGNVHIRHTSFTLQLHLDSHALPNHSRLQHSSTPEVPEVSVFSESPSQSLRNRLGAITPD